MTILNIKRGDKPKAASTIAKAKLQRMNALGFPENTRSALMQRQMVAMAAGGNDPAYVAAMPTLVQFEADIKETLAINTFNAQLQAYRKATARLSKITLAEGREEQVVEPELDEFENVVKEGYTIPAIEPVPTTITVQTFDEEGTPTGEEEVPNPVTEQDAAERASAEAVVAGTPQEVKDF